MFKKLDKLDVWTSTLVFILMFIIPSILMVGSISFIYWATNKDLHIIKKDVKTIHTSFTEIKKDVEEVDNKYTKIVKILERKATK